MVQATLTSALHASAHRVEYLTNPIGTDVARPRLSWIVTSEARTQRQAAYRVLVASDAALLDDERGDLWYSGRVESAETTQVVYGGVPLAARQAAW